jgi:GR25 family glycosyltransferase involved in LPS biosynthesis
MYYFKDNFLKNYSILFNLFYKIKMDLQKLFGVDEVWLINLDRRPDRLEKMKENIYPLFPNIQRFSAVDSKKMSITDFKEVVDSKSLPAVLENKRTYHEELGSGAVGCYLSHVELWMRSLQLNKKILIFEDDTYLMKNKLEELEQGKINIPKDYDVLLLSAQVFNSRDIKGNSHSTESVQQVYKFFGLGAYIVTPQFVHKIYPFLFPIKYQIDALMSFFSFFVDMYAVKLFYQYDDPITDAQTSNEVNKFMGAPECQTIIHTTSLVFIVILILILCLLYKLFWDKNKVKL